MKLVSALAGLAALGGVALSSATASATPIDVPASTTGIVMSGLPPGGDRGEDIPDRRLRAMAHERTSGTLPNRSKTRSYGVRGYLAFWGEGVRLHGGECA